jgi:glycerophosphoryl diester phosphodiesterase family protein
MAHAGGWAHGRENAVTTIQKALVFNPDIIEVDVRKSRDGVLYCHHGSEPWGTIAATFFGIFTFAQIQWLVGQRDTLQAVLAAVPRNTLIYLDLKDRWINADDLRPLIESRKGIWIAPFGSVNWLKHLRTGLGEGHAYSFNRPAVFPRHVARRLAGQADMIQFCVWSWNTETLSEIEGSGTACHMVQWFVSRNRYLASMPLSRWRGLFYSVYNLADASELAKVFDSYSIEGEKQNSMAS